MFHRCIAGKEGRLRVESAAELHDRFLFTAKNELPMMMGSGYAQIAVDCLMCVEKKLGAATQEEGAATSSQQELADGYQNYQDIAASFMMRVIERLEHTVLAADD